MRALLIGALFGTSSLAPAIGAAVASAESCTPRHMCCKVCNRGQACGDTCISRQRTCHTAPGCACDRVEVCD